jgi:hypothetical protein
MPLYTSNLPYVSAKAVRRALGIGVLAKENVVKVYQRFYNMLTWQSSRPLLPAGLSEERLQEAAVLLPGTFYSRLDLCNMGPVHAVVHHMLRW